MNEGGAEFFASFQPIGGRMTPTFENKMRAGTIKGAVGSETFVPMRTFLEYTQQQHYSNAGICYAQGWALTEFLMLGDRSSVKAVFEDRWKQIIPTYFDTLKAELTRIYEERKGKVGDDKGGGDRESVGFLGSQAEREAILKKALEDALDGVDMDALTKVWKVFVKKDL